MRLPWSALGLVGAIASSIPLASSHEIHLAYFPVTTGSDAQTDSYLSVEWSIKGGSLFANNDRVFPPSTSMQVHAPQYDGPQKTRNSKQRELYYSLDARPLSTHEFGAPNSIVQISVELLDQQGNNVTPNTVVLDLLDHPDGNMRITRLRTEPRKSKQSTHSENEQSWQMKYWQSEVGRVAKHPNTQDLSSDWESTSESELKSTSTSTSTSDTTDDSNPSQSQSKNANKPPKPSGVSVASKVGYIFSPYFAPASYSESHSHHRHHGQPRPDQTFMHIIRPVIFPAILGAIAGLIACLLGFFIGHLLMSVSYRLGLCKKQQRQRRHRRSKDSLLEEGTILEKAELVPTIIVTEIDEMDQV
ncbi:hypothetical protein N7478_011657 [Penicillium angulare]|uniref:uncharacterized protein n=1 Tax=Penicillium angulare TaxID=116970 RepID=UPI00254201EE|nr:uncharacterized protein N7478_011657 [Penicillium angulare]KAJ5261062.1 hypothetical protein N7478_011657 [Penicillium angulare]